MSIGTRVLEFGFLILLGVVSGKSLCGKVCPVGFIQGLLYKIPFPRKIKIFKAHKHLRYLKYIILFIVIVLFLVFPMKEPVGNTWAINGNMKWGLTILLLLACMVIHLLFKPIRYRSCREYELDELNGLLRQRLTWCLERYPSSPRTLGWW